MSTLTSAGHQAAAGPGRYLIQFAQRHVDFRIPELEAVLQMRQLPLQQCFPTLQGADLRKSAADSPFLEIWLPSVEDAQYIGRRCVLARGIYRVWSQGKDYQEALESLTKHLPSSTKALLCREDVSWSILVSAFGKSFSPEEQETKRHRLAEVLNPSGPIDIKAPDLKLWIFEDIGQSPEERQRGSAKAIWFVQEIGGSGRHRAGQTSRDLIDLLRLPQRKFLGPTSMDPELSLIMANLGLVSSSSSVLDPFVGSGSILVACAAFGAFCSGGDIDMRVLLPGGERGGRKRHNEKEENGKLAVKAEKREGEEATDNGNRRERVGEVQSGKEGGGKRRIEGSEREDIFSNFSQYNFPRPELFRWDISNPCCRAREERQERSLPIFDAIVCDPPYGIRAGAKRMRKREEKNGEEEEGKVKPPSNIPRAPYEGEEVMNDLLELASLLLREGGRLVYWLPVERENYTDESVPSHPSLRLVANW